MNGEQGAAGALVSALVTVLREVAGLSQVSDGAPIQAGDAAAVVEAGPETDWGFKGGEGAEVRVAILVTRSGEAPARALARRKGTRRGGDYPAGPDRMDARRHDDASIACSARGRPQMDRGRRISGADDEGHCSGIAEYSGAWRCGFPAAGIRWGDYSRTAG